MYDIFVFERCTNNKEASAPISTIVIYSVESDIIKSWQYNISERKLEALSHILSATLTSMPSPWPKELRQTLRQDMKKR